MTLLTIHFSVLYLFSPSRRLTLTQLELTKCEMRGIPSWLGKKGYTCTIFPGAVRAMEYAENVAALAGVLAQSTRLAHLDLSWNYIEDEGAGRLAGVLGLCAALVHLNLGLNHITSDGAGRLAEVLTQCPALAHLNISRESDRSYRSRESCRSAGEVHSVGCTRSQKK